MTKFMYDCLVVTMMRVKYVVWVQNGANVLALALVTSCETSSFREGKKTEFDAKGKRGVGSLSKVITPTHFNFYMNSH